MNNFSYKVSQYITIIGSKPMDTAKKLRLLLKLGEWKEVGYKRGIR
jgi:hypothetical protein